MAGEAFWLGADSSAGDGIGDVDTLTIIDEAAPDSLYVNGAQAVYDADSDRTYYAWHNTNRDLMVGYYDHFTGERATAVQAAARSGFNADDNHAAPSIVVAGDGRILVAWGTAASGSNVQVTRSTNPRDISAWSTTSIAPATTYPTLIVAPNDDVLMFHWPAATTAGIARYAVRRSTDHGATWGSLTDVVDSTGVNANAVAYVFPVSLDASGLVHLTWTVGNSVSGARTGVYHAIYDPVAGTMSNAAGTDLGATVGPSEHPDCLVASGTQKWALRHLVLDDGRIFITHPAGTDGTHPEGTYTVQVARWNGSAWSSVDTGVAFVYRYAHHEIVPYRDGLLGLFCEDNGTFTDVTAWVSPDGVTWHSAGAVLTGDQGEGYESVMKVADGPFLAFAEQMPTDWSVDPADGAFLIVAIGRPVAFDGHVHAVVSHDHDADYAAVAHTHASGAGELLMQDGVTAPPVPVENEARDDWLYQDA